MRRTVFALLGGLAGLVLGLGWQLVLSRIALPDPWPGWLRLAGDGGLWLAGGSLTGLFLAGPPAGGRDRRTGAVAMAPARCAWCGGGGYEWGLFRCGVCGGQGHVLVVQPKKQCAWCRGTGARWLIFRCEACGGGGWLNRRSGG
jgi:hypothetical protein